MRLAELGATRLDPELRVTHLKRWTAKSVILTDIRQRAVPWTRLLLERGEMPDDLNLRWSQRLAAVLSPLALAAFVALPFSAGFRAWWVVLASAVVVVASLGLNAPLVRSFARLRGWWFAFGAWLFHQVHLFYSAVTYVLCRILVR